jgi:hypothetical protein
MMDIIFCSGLKAVHIHLKITDEAFGRVAELLPIPPKKSMLSLSDEMKSRGKK